ncbi:DJ-1/PfpI family protein [Planctomycetota bacterium]
MKKAVFLLLCIFDGFVYAQEFMDLYGDYLGQNPPGDTAAIDPINKARLSGVELTYIGNSGFLIECADKKILVDAQFGDGDTSGSCQKPPMDLLKKMAAAEPPFNDVDLIAATHSHGDHFDAQWVAKHLKSNPHAQFISTAQSLARLKKNCLDFNSFSDRVYCKALAKTECWQQTLNGIKIKAYGLTHSPPQVNINVMGLLFEIDGIKIFHNGDTSYPAHTEFAAIDLKQEDIDLGLIHKGMFFWNRQQGWQVVAETINPKHIVLHHVYNDEQDRIAKNLPELRKSFPSIDVPQNYLDHFTFAHENTYAKPAKKSILMIIGTSDFRDEELLEPKSIFEAEEAKVTIASTTLMEVTGMLGAKVKPDILVKDVDVNDYDAIVFVGGLGAQQYFHDKLAHKIVNDANKQEKLICAICIAPNVLANAGILEGKRATCWPNQDNPDNLIEQGANYTGKDVERDGRIITGSGPYSATDFGKTILKALSMQAK